MVDAAAEVIKITGKPEANSGPGRLDLEGKQCSRGLEGR